MRTGGKGWSYRVDGPCWGIWGYGDAGRDTALADVPVPQEKRAQRGHFCVYKCREICFGSSCPSTPSTLDEPRGAPELLSVPFFAAGHSSHLRIHPAVQSTSRYRALTPPVHFPSPSAPCPTLRARQGSRRMRRGIRRTKGPRLRFDGPSWTAFGRECSGVVRMAITWSAAVLENWMCGESEGKESVQIERGWWEGEPEERAFEPAGISRRPIPLPYEWVCASEPVARVAQRSTFIDSLC